MVYNSKIRVQASVYLDQSSVLSLYIFQNKTFVSNTVCACVSVTQLCLTLCDPMDCSHQAPLFMDFSRQEYWSGLPFSSPGDLPNPGVEPRSPALHEDSSQFEPSGKSTYLY